MILMYVSYVRLTRRTPENHILRFGRMFNYDTDKVFDISSKKQPYNVWDTLRNNYTMRIVWNVNNVD